MRHACASYVMTTEYGPSSTRIAGVANEFIGFFLWDLKRLGSRLHGETPWAFQASDMRSNEIGIQNANAGAAMPPCESLRYP